MDDKKFQSLSAPQQQVVLKIAKEAERQGVNPELAIAIAEAETGGKFSHLGKEGVLTSTAGAQGLMQLLPSTVKLYNEKLNAEIDPLDEDSNIKGGVFILKDLLTKYKKPRIAVAMYNASPKANAEFVRQYETDPDAAIMSLRPETHKYSLRISKNFNLDDENETGLITAPKADPFADYESESAKLKQEQDAQAEADKNKPPQPKTLLDRASEAANELDPAKAALVGAGVNAIFPMFTDPKVSPKVDTGKAVEANASAQDKLELARQDFQDSVPQGMYSLEETYRQNQLELERIKNEQRLAQERLKGMPKAPPAIGDESLPMDSDAPSRTKAGASGASNWVRAMGEGVPDVLADQAANMRKDNPLGGQAIIDKDMVARQRQADLGLGDYSLTRTVGGVQLALPPTTVAERQAEIERQNQANQAELERKAYETKIQQETQNWIAEQQKLAHEEQLERLRQERVAAGQRQNILASQTRAAAPLQKALTKAEKDAELARRKLLRAQEQPNMAGRTLERVGIASTFPSKIGSAPRAITGGALGYFGVMSYQEALQRLKEGDTSEGVLKALQAGSAGLSLLPPAGKKMTQARGLGKAVVIPTYGYELGRSLLKERPDEK
jgi:hypothetical protein